MPIYVYSCPCGEKFERYLAVADYDTLQKCECGLEARRVICAPMMVSVKEIRYESPIDGKPVTSKQARQEDLARSGCIEYDPEMKTDYNRRIEREEKELENKMEQSVNAAIAQMPTKKRETLVSELQSGADIDTLRLTA